MPLMTRSKPEPEIQSPRITVRSLRVLKEKKEKIAVLTAYDYFTAQILDEIGLEAILVGDSANMVFYGAPSTLSITMEQMLYHTRAVATAVKRALVIADMPFLSYQPSIEVAITNAGRFLKEGQAQAVKLEGGLEMAETIKHLVALGIPVMGHIGLIPQSVHRFGGYAVQGKEKASRKYLLESARALENSGCFSIVLEGIKCEVARQITQELKIPTIGIGAGPDCDGQVLVINDLLGLYEEFKPKFVRRYAHLAREIRNACGQYLQDVKAKRFPSIEESY